MRIIRSFIPQVIAGQNMTLRDFVGRCYSLGMDNKTAVKLAEGNTNIQLETLAIVRRVLNVASIRELVEFELEGE